jgi:tetratricopeptide (TPR) repeat protein
MLSKPAIHAEGAPKFSLLVVGRLHGLTRKRLRDVVEQVGGELLGRPSSRVDLVALAQGSAQMVLRAAPALELPNGLDSRIRSISEMTLKRMLRLVSPAVGEERTLDRDDVLRASKLSPEVLECLAAFDVVEPVDGQYAYRDVLVTREVRRLLDREYELATIVEASLVLRRSGASLSEVRLLEAPWGELVQETCGALASLTGQLTLPLSHDMVSPEDLFQRAEVSEVSGDLASAEHFYRAAMAVDRADAAIPYNLGNVLDAQGRRPEAILAYYEALQRDPDFAEAWFNLGVIDEEEGRVPNAIQHYQAAVSKQPNFADALYNLALLLTEQEVYEAAGPLWERFIRLSPHGPDTARARRCVTLCRMAQSALTNRPPSASKSMGVPHGGSAAQSLLC